MEDEKEVVYLRPAQPGGKPFMRVDAISRGQSGLLAGLPDFLSRLRQEEEQATPTQAIVAWGDHEVMESDAGGDRDTGTSTCFELTDEQAAQQPHIEINLYAGIFQEQRSSGASSCASSSSPSCSESSDSEDEDQSDSSTDKEDSHDTMIDQSNPPPPPMSTAGSANQTQPGPPLRGDIPATPLRDNSDLETSSDIRVVHVIDTQQSEVKKRKRKHTNQGESQTLRQISKDIRKACPKPVTDTHSTEPEDLARSTPSSSRQLSLGKLNESGSGKQANHKHKGSRPMIEVLESC